jgi:hypothetical protein
MFRSPIILSALLSAFLLPASAHGQSVRLFTDWHAACDNQRSCALLGMAPLDADSYAFIDLRRGAGASAEAQVSLAFTFETESQELPIEIAFDPPGSESLFPRDARAQIGRDGLLRLDLPKENLASFIAALRRAEFLRIRRLDEAPKDQSATTISLKGAVAALRWIDEQQLRNGNVTALIARGDRPASAIPSPPNAPLVTRSPFQARQIEGKASADIKTLHAKACPDLDDDAKDEETGYQITPDTLLWQMPCTRGAYNVSSAFLLQPRASAPRLLQFEKPESGKLVRNLVEIVNGEFIDDDRSIFFFARGRGVGDCGARGAYVWDGRAFVLTSWQEMTACRGAPLDLWPVVWRAETRGR